jgi:hypothetical protein
VSYEEIRIHPLDFGVHTDAKVDPAAQQAAVVIGAVVRVPVTGIGLVVTAT